MIEKDKREINILLDKITDYSSNIISQTDFYYEIVKIMLEITNSNSIELLINEGSKLSRTYISSYSKNAYNFEVYPDYSHNFEQSSNNKYNNLYSFYKDNPKQKFAKKFTFKSLTNGILIIYDLNEEFYNLFTNHRIIFSGERLSNFSLLISPLSSGNLEIGLLGITSIQSKLFSTNNIALLEEIISKISSAIVFQKNHSKLIANSKQLSFFHKFTQLICQNKLNIEELFKSLIELLPQAMQYPEITSIRIVLNGKSYTSKYYQNSSQRLVSYLIIKNEKKGFIEIIYSRLKPECDFGPFLKEEKELIDTLSKQIAQLVEFQESENERKILQDEIRHADRLNVVGQLAAGIAHELNEPLGSILGFAQLTKKSQGLPENISKDIDKIIKSALFARDIIRKLLSFSKEMPPQLKEVNLNKIVLEGLYFLESRCQKNSIELIRNLKNDLPHILADEFQINQVLINLVVNAIQAMPNGGKLTISTDNSVDYVYLIVEDTGIGMSEEIRKKIFLPFFSTKSINEGTGLGLTVCYGIISSHNGTINVESTLGKGSRFEIKIPIYSDSKVKI